VVERVPKTAPKGVVFCRLSQVQRLMRLISSDLVIDKLERKGTYRYVLRRTRFEEGKGQQDLFSYGPRRV
jgi:hypothetical protein